MAKKKQPAKSDKPAEKPSDETKPGSSPEIPDNSKSAGELVPTSAAPALPAGYVPARKRDIDLIVYVRVRKKDLVAKEIEIEDAVAVVKRLKAEAKEIANEIDRMITYGPDDPSLFDKHDRPEAPALTYGEHGEVEIQWEISPHRDAATPSDGPSNVAGPAVDESWKGSPLYGTLKQPKNATLNKALKMIEEADYLTVGKLESLRALRGVGWYDVIPGLGAAGANLVNQAVDAYLESTRDKAAFDAARGPADSAPKSVEFGFDQKYDIVRFIQHERDINPKITAKQLSRLLKGSMRIAEVAKGESLDGAWTCDDVGICVETYHGQAVPVDRNTITYAEAVEIIKGVHKPAAAEQTPPFDEAAMWAELLRHFIERWRIGGPMNTTVLKNVTYPAAGKFRIFEWTNADDGIHVHTPDAVERVLSYADAAKILKTFDKAEFYDPSRKAEGPAAEKSDAAETKHDDGDPRLLDVATLLYEDPRLNFGTEFDAAELRDELKGKFGENANLRWDGTADALVVSSVSKGGRTLTKPASASYERMAELLREVIDAAYANADDDQDADEE